MLQIFSRKYYDDVLRWAHEIAPGVGHNLEFQVACTKRPYSFGRPIVEVVTTLMADSKQDALDSLEFMRQSPLKKKSILRSPYIGTNMRALYEIFTLAFRDNHRWCVDNTWTHADPQDVLPVLNQAVDTMPPAPSSIYWLHWKPRNDRPDMAFSLEDESYIAFTGAWKNQEDDARYANWATEHARALEPFSTGIQLADENLHTRPAKFMADENLQRLDTVRLKWDQDKLFHEWHSRTN